MDITISNAEYQEALVLARESLGNGGQRTFLAKALLRADAKLRVATMAERERCARIAARVGANKGDESGYLGGVAAEIEEAIRSGEG